MIFIIIIYIILISENRVQSIDLNSVIPRSNCFRNKQADCNQEFIDAYPNLSKSATNLTDADTYFLLFTRRNQDEPEKLHKCGGRLPPSTKFDATQELIVLLIAFTANFCEVAMYREWVNQMLQRGNYNVLVVDYSWGNRIDYGVVILNAKIVAKQTAVVLKNIQDQTEIKNSAISLMGISMGAQLAGFIGQEFRVRKITALDPSGPGFDARITPKEDRLDMGDAEFVEVWHCNGGRCLPNFGTAYDVGHVNFHINGGNIQSSCHKYALTSFLKKDFIYAIGTALVNTLCYHAHCGQYYKVSINPGKCKFVAVRCRSLNDFNSGKCKCGENGENCIVMGFDTEKYIKRKIRRPRKYFLNTTDECPYCDNNPSYLGGFSDPYAKSCRTIERNKD